MGDAARTRAGAALLAMPGVLGLAGAAVWLVGLLATESASAGLRAFRHEGRDSAIYAACVAVLAIGVAGRYAVRGKGLVVAAVVQVIAGIGILIQLQMALESVWSLPRARGINITDEAGRRIKEWTASHGSIPQTPADWDEFRRESGIEQSMPARHRDRPFVWEIPLGARGAQAGHAESAGSSVRSP